jgi:hypothetical protein
MAYCEESEEAGSSRNKQTVIDCELQSLAVCQGFWTAPFSFFNQWEIG